MRLAILAILLSSTLVGCGLLSPFKREHTEALRDLELLDSDAKNLTVRLDSAEPEPFTEEDLELIERMRNLTPDEQDIAEEILRMLEEGEYQN